MDDRDVFPDESLLRHLFPDAHAPRISIFLQNWNKCVFLAEFQEENSKALPTPQRPPLVVRLEADDTTPTSFALVAAMQNIAANCLADLVPKTLQTGVVANSQGRLFQFCVMEHVQGRTLEDLWDGMSNANRQSVTAALADAVQRLHTVRLSDDAVQKILRQSVALGEAKMGGPVLGFLNDGPALLAAIEERWKLKKPFYTTEPLQGPEGESSGSLVLRSLSSDIKAVTIENLHMQQWPSEAVLCHNDLTPRNIILKPSSKPTDAPDSSLTYGLSAIIDWEIAGFYPPSYELSLQDTYLGNGNRCLSFYLLLKSHLKGLVPATPSQVVLSRSIELIFESRQAMLYGRRNIPARIRQSFMKLLQLSRDEDSYTGWICKDQAPDGSCREFSQADAQKLENEVAAEILAIKEKKAQMKKDSHA